MNQMYSVNSAHVVCIAYYHVVLILHYQYEERRCAV